MKRILSVVISNIATERARELSWCKMHRDGSFLSEITEFQTLSPLHVVALFPGCLAFVQLS